MTDERLNVILQAQDRASGELKNAEKGFGGLKSSISSTMDVAKGFVLAEITMRAGQAIKDMAVGAFKDYNELQLGIAQTNNVIKSTGGVAGVTAEEVTKLSDAFESTTKFSDDQVRSVENLLLTFTNINKDIFPQATSLTLDMAQALGEDTKSAAIQLGKALQDPVLGVTALRRVGVNFNSDQQKVIKNLVDTGKSAEAQKLIMAELTREFGGSAKAAGETLSGKLTILKNHFNDMKRDMAGRVITWLEQIDWTKILDGAKQMWKAVQPIVTAFTGYLKELWTVFSQNLLPDIERLWKALNPALMTALKVVAAIIGLELIVSLKAATIVLRAIGDVMNWVTSAIVWGANEIKRIWNGIPGAFHAIVGGVTSAFRNVANDITWPFRTAFNAIARMWNDTVGKMSFHAPSWVPGIGGKGFDMPRIPYLAKGGIVTAPTLAMIGEAGPEAVIPLNSSKASSITNNVGGNISLSVSVGMYAGMPSEKRKIAVDIYRELVREARAHNVQLPQLGSGSVQ